MNKKWKNRLLITVFLVLSVCLLCSVDTQAAKKKPKQKVTWKVKKKTLIFSGKGKMRFRALTDLKGIRRSKIKKVIIKKGVTSISSGAFWNFKNLKKVSIPSTVKRIGGMSFSNTAITKLKIPKSVKVIEGGAFNNNPQLKQLTLPGNYKTNVKRDEKIMLASDGNNLKVVFTTKVRKIAYFSQFNATNYVVAKKDSKYRSIDGSVYTKNGKTLVRVPFQKRKLRIAEGCTQFCLQSVLHGIPDHGEQPPIQSCAVQVIDIPASVKKIESKKYFSMKPKISLLVVDVKKITIRSKQLDGNSLLALTRDLHIHPKEVMRQFPGQVSYKNGAYVTRDGVTLIWHKEYYVGMADD